MTGTVIVKETDAIVIEKTTVVTRRTRTVSPTKTANEIATEIVTEIEIEIENVTVEDAALTVLDRGLLIDEESVNEKETETVIVDIAATAAIRVIDAVAIAAAPPVAIGTATTRKAAMVLPMEPTSLPMARSPLP